MEKYLKTRAIPYTSWRPRYVCLYGKIRIQETKAFFEKEVGTWPRECARTIENISRIRMDVARASGDEIWTKSDVDRESSILI